MTDTTAFSFLALTSFADEHHHPHEQQVVEEEEETLMTMMRMPRRPRRESSTHDSVEWFLYGAEDHSLLQAQPPHAFLTLTADKNEDDDQDSVASQQDPSTHEPSLYHTE
ncbi:hypothetical protein BCR42DRAFT_430540 [Absidia repens]|uniref:Uncharacterized protein n=1 Tax=Absidia repens TaxID=90262 RepID=A0A1X2HDU0_9FUNG|nr:hypothetical protein BCR42DRAFT_430540 [Absidia repens]